MRKVKDIAIIISAVGLAIFLILFVNVIFGNHNGKDILYSVCGMFYFVSILGILVYKHSSNYSEIFQWVLFALAILPFLIIVIVFFELSGVHA